MSIASELTNLAENRDAIKAAIIGKRPSILPGDGLSSFPAAIDSIPDVSEPPRWSKPSSWPDAEAILAADDHSYPYKRIELLSDGMLSTYLTGGNAYYTSEGNLYTTSTTITWDKSKDIVAEDGTRYRWVISFSNNGTFNNLCGVGANLLWYVLGAGSVASHTFNGRFLCQKIKGTIVSSGTSQMGGESSLVEIEGDLTFTATNCGEMFQDCGHLVRIVGSLSCPNATSTNKMFAGCGSLFCLPDGFTIDNATSCSSMFTGCYSLKRLPSVFSCPLSSSPSYMFMNCYDLEELPSGFTFASGAANVYGLFSGCHSLKRIPDSLAPAICSAQSLGGIVQFCWSLEYFPPITSSVATNISAMIRELALGCDIQKLDFGNSPITSYEDFSHCASSFPDEFIATNMTGTASFPSGYLYIDKIPSKLRVNVPVNLPITRAGSAQKDRLATFDQSGNVNGGLVYNVYDLTSDPSYVSGTYKKFRLQVNNDLKNSFTQEQKDAISSFLSSKGWALSW